MAITFVGTGSLFLRLGKVFGTARNVNGLRGTTAPDTTAYWGSGGTLISAIQTNINNIQAQYASTLQRLPDGIYGNLASFRSAQASLLAQLKILAQNTVIEMADADVHLTQRTLKKAMEVVISQMGDATLTVDANAVSAAVTAGSTNNGDGVCTVSVTGPDGKKLEYSFNETIDITCTSDSQLSSGLLGVEPFSAEGDVPVTDTLDYLWPAGSGCRQLLTAIDASGTSPQLLSNGDFEDFTLTNTPGDWSIAVGAAGTDIFAAGAGYSGDNALKLTGTGGTPLTELYQAVDLEPLTVYAFCMWLKKTTSLAAGVLTVKLYDGSATINDAAGAANSTTKTLSALTTSYTPFAGFFRTPRVLPATTQFRLKITTALTNGESAYIDDVTLAKATQLYTGGPFAAIFSGATKFITNDIFHAAITNDFGGQYQTCFEQFFGMRSMGLQLPSDASGSETIGDSSIS